MPGIEVLAEDHVLIVADHAVPGDHAAAFAGRQRGRPAWLLPGNRIHHVVQIAGGVPRRITGGNNVPKQRETIDHAGILIEYHNGAKVEFGFCLFAPEAGSDARSMRIIGSQGIIQQSGGKTIIRKKGSREATPWRQQTPRPRPLGPSPSARTKTAVPIASGWPS
jgi:hypothetical protein